MVAPTQSPKCTPDPRVTQIGSSPEVSNGCQIKFHSYMKCNNLLGSDSPAKVPEIISC